MIRLFDVDELIGGVVQCPRRWSLDPSEAALPRPGVLSKDKGRTVEPDDADNVRPGLEMINWPILALVAI